MRRLAGQSVIPFSIGSKGWSVAAREKAVFPAGMPDGMLVTSS